MCVLLTNIFLQGTDRVLLMSYEHTTMGFANLSIFFLYFKYFS